MKPINFEIWHLVVKKTSLLKTVGILLTDQFDIQIIDMWQIIEWSGIQIKSPLFE